MTPKKLDEWLTDIDCGSWGEREDVSVSAASEVFAVVTGLRAELLAIRAAHAQLLEQHDTLKQAAILLISVAPAPQEPT